MKKNNVFGIFSFFTGARFLDLDLGFENARFKDDNKKVC